MGTLRQRTNRDWIELQLYDHASARQHRELGAFVRYCVLRIERELGEPERWIVRISPAVDGFHSTVSVHDGDLEIETTGAGLDGALAVWDALCSLEQALREARNKRTAAPSDDRFDATDAALH